jgi:RNA polymerase sigma-70 factor (ECF subfamily)
MSRGRPQLELVAPVQVDEANRVELLDPDQAFRRYAPYVAAVAHRLLGREHDVDDTIQDVFVIAVRGLSRIRDQGAVRSWLASVTVRVARRRLRFRRARSLLGFDEPWQYDNVASASADPEQRALLSALYRMLDKLPVPERIAWTLHHIEGETLDSVAILCGCSLSTAKRRIRRAALAIEEVFHD